MSTIGNKAATQHVSLQKQTITGNGGTSYSLQQSVGSALDIAVFVNNTRQEPAIAYSASGTTLTMTGAVNASDNFYVIFLGKGIATTGLPIDVVGTSNINASAITAAKLANDAVTHAKLPSGSILQAVGNKQGTGTAVNINANNTWLGTGFGKSITPSSTSSKILIMCSVNLYNGLTGNYYSANIYRHTAAFTANGAVSGTQLFNDEKGFGTTYRSSGNGFDNSSAFLIDEPNTTSEVYYNVCHKRAGSSSGIFDGYNMDSTIALLEVAG